MRLLHVLGHPVCVVGPEDDLPSLNKINLESCPNMMYQKGQGLFVNEPAIARWSPVMIEAATAHELGHRKADFPFSLSMFLPPMETLSIADLLLILLVNKE